MALAYITEYRVSKTAKKKHKLLVLAGSPNQLLALAKDECRKRGGDPETLRLLKAVATAAADKTNPPCSRCGHRKPRLFVNK